MFEQRVRNQDISFSAPVNSKTITINMVKTRTGTGVPDWRNKLKHCIDASSPYSLRDKKILAVHFGSWRVQADIYFPGGETLFASVFGSGHGVVSTGTSSYDPTLFVPTDALNNAKRKFVQRCLSEQTVFQGGVVLGELHKTVESIRHPFQALRRATSDYLDLVKIRATRASRGFKPKKGQNRDAAHRRSVAGAIQGTYLEYVYGIKPTLQDMSDAVKAAAHLVDPDFPVRRSVSAFANFRYVAESLSNVDTSGHSVNDGTRESGKVFAKSFVVVSGSVRYSGALRCLTPGHDRVQLLGLNLGRFVPTLWELLPYSFLVDYFVNVGDVFDALSFNTSDLAYGSQTIKCSLIETHTEDRLVPLQQVWTKTRVDVDQPSLLQIETLAYDRTPIGFGTLIPTVQLSVPSARQLVNVGALALQHQSVVNWLSKLF